MDGCLRKQDDGYTDGVVREIWNGGGVVRRGEDVGGERSGAIEARVVAGSLSKRDSVAGREDSIAGSGRGVSGRKRWGVGG